jgi:dolichol-phosphate mannosyltransferase
MDLSIVVPCCNEADNVGKLKSEFMPIVQELARTRSVEVIFVDDGSTDETWLALNNTFGNGHAPPGLAIRFERHRVNRGLGAALRTGFAAAQGEIVLSTDADGTYKFDTIPAVLEKLRPNVDMVTASPYAPGGQVVGVPRYRLVLSQGASALYRLLVAWNVYTWTCLFRVYRRKVLETISFEADGFLAGTELMVKALLAGYRMAEYPAVLHSRVAGASKAKIWRTIKAHLQFQWRVLLHRAGLKSLFTGQDHVQRGGLTWKPVSRLSTEEKSK